MWIDIVQMSLAVAIAAATALVLLFATLPHRLSRLRLVHFAWLPIALFLLGACQPVTPESATNTGANTAENSVVIYSGRSETLVAPLIEQFEAATGINAEVRYGGTAEMAATILEEGSNSPADVFFAQDAGALGALAKLGIFTTLPDEILAAVPAELQSPEGQWIGVSGRARVLVYNTEELTEADLPDDVWGLTDPAWAGRVGWAPTNASFQAFITAMRILEGEDAARQWLEAMIANDTVAYPNNGAIVTAVAAGEVSVGLVNHYYLYGFLQEQGEDFTARNYHFRTPHAGSMINIAGVGILNTASNPEAAQAFVEFLISEEAQQYFATETNEYPLIAADIETPAGLVPLAEIAAPDLDLSDIDDLEVTLTLLQEVGVLE
jgi:iron(III) transport system substrate-binding protein